jgi:sulfate/thiosulfate transport system ATP-binding protein
MAKSFLQKIEQEQPIQMEPAKPAIEVRGISKQFGKQKTLVNVDLAIDQGEMLVVLGPSGSGKTTLLRILAGLEHADSGEIMLSGERATHLPPQARNLGVVFQEHALFQRMTVEQNIGFGLKVGKSDRSKIETVVNDMLKLVRLEDHRKKYPAQLSGGQRQRVALARALAFEPSAVLFDEPFSALDAVTRVELRQEVRELLHSMKISALFITHDQEEALDIADRIVVLNSGAIEQIGTPFEVYNHPINEFVATFLGAANVLLGSWSDNKVSLGNIKIDPPSITPHLINNQAVKVIFRPEDLVLNFQAQLLNTPYYLGRATISSVSYVGPTERLILTLSLAPTQLASKLLNSGEGFPITVSRSKWDATEMPLSSGDQVVVGLKDYRILPHYPLRSGGSKTHYFQE